MTENALGNCWVSRWGNKLLQEFSLSLVGEELKPHERIHSEKGMQSALQLAVVLDRPWLQPCVLPEGWPLGPPQAWTVEGL